jgi:uncharacterized protein YgiB involved in biofilm formation
MKRSRTTTLLLVTSALVGAAALAGCEQTQEGGVFRTVQECRSAGFPQSECERSLTAALAEHRRTAERFTSREDCESVYGPGQCAQPEQQQAQGAYQGSGGNNSLLWYWMLTRPNGYAYSPGGYGQPLYRYYDPSTRRYNSHYESPRGDYFGTTTGRTQVSPRAMSARPATTTTVSRGGFGSSARAASVAG